MKVLFLHLAPVLVALLLTVEISAQTKNVRTTIVYDDVATSVSAAREDAGQLWITTADLKRATRFEVKPQGVCRDEICIPLPKARKQEFLRKDSGLGASSGVGSDTSANKSAGSDNAWFNLSGFASLTHQAVAHDTAESVWYFGLRSDQRQWISSLQAPDFTLPDINGKMHSLSDFRGKKVLLLTWASW
jgi:hypothetical protein